MKIVTGLLTCALTFAQAPTVRKEHWGMTQVEVIKVEKHTPLKRNERSLVYRDKESGIPAQVIFEFTVGSLDQVSYVAESTSPEVAFLTWSLALTKRYGQGVLYLNHKPVGPVGLMMDESLKQFWRQKDGEILAIFPPEGTTNVGVGITLMNGSPLVEMDYAETPKAKI